MSTAPAKNTGLPVPGAPVEDTTFEEMAAGTANAQPVLDSVSEEPDGGPVPIVKSEDFFVEPANVIKGALEHDIASVVIVTRTVDGRVEVASSHGTPATIGLLNSGIRKIEEDSE